MLKYNIYLCRSEQEYTEIWIFFFAKNKKYGALSVSEHSVWTSVLTPQSWFLTSCRFEQRETKSTYNRVHLNVLVQKFPVFLNHSRSVHIDNI